MPYYDQFCDTIMKKSIELSVLCNQTVFVLIHDKANEQVIHYASDPSVDVLEVFSQQHYRKFVSNNDYKIMGYKNPALLEGQQNQNMSEISAWVLDIERQTTCSQMYHDEKSTAKIGSLYT